MTKRLKDSVLFGETVYTDKMKSTMRKIDLSKAVQISDIQSELSIIEKRVTQPTKFKILDLLYDKKIILIKDSNVDLPIFLSNVTFKDSIRETRSLVLLNKYSKTNNIVNNPTVLFGLLQNALIGYELENNWDKYKNNDGLMIYSSIAYSRMMSKIMDKLYSANLDPIYSDFLSFVFAKFFLLSVVGREAGDSIDMIAYKSVYNGTALPTIKDRESTLDVESLYLNIVTLFNTLSSIPGKRIRFRSFLESYIKMNGESATLSLDFLPAFYQTIFAAAVSATLNKEFAIINTVSSQVLVKAFVNFSKLI